MRTLQRLFTRIAALCFLALLAAPTQATPPSDAAERTTNHCLDHRLVEDWHSRRSLEARGFFFDIIGKQASVDFGRTMTLKLASDPSISTYAASRITDIDTSPPIAQRVKCWQATPQKNVVVEFSIRFKQAAPPPGLTENLLLWNAPLPSKARPEPAVPATAFGVSRNSLTGAPQYQAVIAQDIPPSASTQPFVMDVQPMPAWLHADQWQRVRITLSQRAAQIEVAQGYHPFTLVAQATLLHPAEPLGVVLSVDNEVLPGSIAPVVVPDSLEVSYLKIGMVPAHNK